MAEVLVKGGRGLAQEITLGSHTLVADEPTEAGGSDTGPSPYDLLLAALGACSAMTVRMYADRKGWPLEEVQVFLSHSRLHASDCRESETSERRLDRIVKRLAFKGPLDDAQRERLAQIAARCPVQLTLTRGVQVEQETEG